MTKQRTNKLFIMLWVFMLCIGMIPITAMAAGGIDEIIVNNVNIVTAPNYTVQCGTGTAVYDPQEETLTLDQAEITVGAKASSTAGERYGIAVKFGTADTLQIILNGNNKITLSDAQYRNMGIWATNSSLKFSGGGSLNVSLYNEKFPCAINGKNLEFDNVKIVCNQLNNQDPCGYAIRTAGTVISTNSSFDVTGFECAIDSGSLEMKKIAV